VSTVAESFFVDVEPGPLGRRFGVCHRPAAGPVRAALVYVHPFAEEMNKSRRMVSQQARRLASAGYLVLQMDLLGCGDSAGDFGDATWARWVDDVLAACRHAQTLVPGVPLWLWGLRAGCLLAAEAAARLDPATPLLFWQPTPNGAPILQQFLRLKAAGEMLSGGAKGVVDGLRAELAANQPVEVAGYTLNPGLAQGLQKASLRPVPTRVEWLEVSAQPEAGWSPAAQMALQGWQRAGAALRSSLLSGPPFWHTTEIEDAPALWDATLAALQADAAQAPALPAIAGSVAA